MIETINYNRDKTSPKLDAILSRSPDFSAEQETTVREIVATVKKQGDRALLAYTKKYDGIDMKTADMRVPESEIKAAHRNADPKFIEIIDAAATNIHKFHEAQRQTSYFIEDGDGVILGKRILPIERVALLIPARVLPYSPPCSWPPSPRKSQASRTSASPRHRSQTAPYTPPSSPQPITWGYAQSTKSSARKPSPHSPMAPTPYPALTNSSDPATHTFKSQKNSSLAPLTST